MKMSFAERKQKEKEDLIATYKSYVNKKARVYFEGKWYTTTILSFDVDKMRHQIKYDKEQSTEIINMKALEKDGHIRWMKPKVIKKNAAPTLASLKKPKAFFLHFYTAEDIAKYLGIMTMEELQKKVDFDTASTYNKIVYRKWAKQYVKDPKHPICKYNTVYPRHMRLPFLLRTDIDMKAFCPPAHQTIKVTTKTNFTEHCYLSL